jgi:hypothetical protein
MCFHETDKYYCRFDVRFITLRVSRWQPEKCIWLPELARRYLKDQNLCTESLRVKYVQYVPAKEHANETVNAGGNPGGDYLP